MFTTYKFNAVQPKELFANRSKSGGCFLLVPGNPLPTIQWSQLVSGIEKTYPIAQLDGLELVVTEAHKQTQHKIYFEHDVKITTDKISTWVNKQVEKHTLAWLFNNQLISDLDKASQDYFKQLITLAKVDLNALDKQSQLTQLKQMALATIAQTSRQASLSGTNKSLNKLLEAIPQDKQDELANKLLEMSDFAYLTKLLPSSVSASDTESAQPSLPIWESTETPKLEQPKPDMATLQTPSDLAAKQEWYSIREYARERDLDSTELLLTNYSSNQLKDLAKVAGLTGKGKKQAIVNQLLEAIA